MVEVNVLVPAIISVILIFVALHFVVILLFPRVKTMIMGLTKDEKVANAIVAALFFIIIVYLASALIPLLEASTIPFVSYIAVFKTPVGILVKFVEVLQWVVVAVVVALGLK